MYARMRTRMIILAVLILIVEIMLVGIFCCGRWGWKLLGFRVCNATRINSVIVEDGTVHIQGADPGIPPAGYLGYVYEEVDDKLYVGIHCSSIFGILENSSFDISIPVEGDIREVWLRTSETEYPIWTPDEGLLTD